MPSEKLLNTLREILYHIDLAKHFVDGFQYDTFAANLRTAYGQNIDRGRPNFLMVITHQNGRDWTLVLLLSRGGLSRVAGAWH